MAPTRTVSIALRNIEHERDYCRTALRKLWRRFFSIRIQNKGSLWSSTRVENGRRFRRLSANTLHARFLSPGHLHAHSPPIPRPGVKVTPPKRHFRHATVKSTHDTSHIPEWHARGERSSGDSHYYLRRQRTRNPATDNPWVNNPRLSAVHTFGAHGPCMDVLFLYGRQAR